jgi:hypothetical protein
MRRFDVFGRMMGVDRKDDRWQVYDLGPDGKRREARDIMIPASVPEEQLALYLAEIFHESASPRRPEVLELDP